MKTKLKAILIIILFSGIFAACTEEEIAPQVANQDGVEFGSARQDKSNF